MSTNSDILFISPEEMENTFLRILKKRGFSEEKAQSCARIFMENSLDGVYSHGVNRFSRFVEYVQKGYVKPDQEPVCTNSSGAIEQWDGQLGPGPLNALHCTERAMEIARQHGMGCVALAHTNHWMRGGSYGWKAAREGFVFIGWTNTIANMPAWGALDPKLGNNPLVLAVPFNRDEHSTDSQQTFPEAIVLDMAMSQFSFGSLEDHQLKGKSTPVPAGYDQHGRFSTDPEAVLESRRILPSGYWKGAGLSLLLDILATLLSGGLSTAAISQKEAEYGVSQVFMALDTSRLSNYSSIYQLTKGIIEDYHRSEPAGSDSQIRYPGERVLKTRQQNFKNGIPVHPQVWNEILALNNQ